MLREAATIAVVGLSSDPSRPSHRVARYLQSYGYRIIPVNPQESEVLGERAYPDLDSVPELVDMVDVFRRSEHVRPVIEEAVRLGIPRIWLQDGVTDEEGAAFARAHGAQVVMNDCTMRVHHRSGRPARDPHSFDKLRAAPDPLPGREGKTGG